MIKPTNPIVHPIRITCLSLNLDQNRNWKIILKTVHNISSLKKWIYFEGMAISQFPIVQREIVNNVCVLFCFI